MTSRSDLPPIHYPGRDPGKSLLVNADGSPAVLPEPDRQTLMRRRINDHLVELHAKRRAGTFTADDAEALQDLHELQASVLGGVARPARGLIVKHTHKRKMPSGKVEILSRSEYRALRAVEHAARRRKRVKVRDIVIGTGLEPKPKRQRRARLKGVLLALLALLVVGCRELTACEKVERAEMQIHDFVIYQCETESCVRHVREKYGAIVESNRRACAAEQSSD